VPDDRNVENVRFDAGRIDDVVAACISLIDGVRQHRNVHDRSAHRKEANDSLHDDQAADNAMSDDPSPDHEATDDRSPMMTSLYIAGQIIAHLTIRDRTE
jgi:hypothetical protein